MISHWPTVGCLKALKVLCSRSPAEEKNEGKGTVETPALRVFSIPEAQLQLASLLTGHMGMDQYLLIPFLMGWTSIYQLFWCSPGVQGLDTLPYGEFVAKVFSILYIPSLSLDLQIVWQILICFTSCRFGSGKIDPTMFICAPAQERRHVRQVECKKDLQSEMRPIRYHPFGFPYWLIG